MLGFGYYRFAPFFSLYKLQCSVQLKISLLAPFYWENSSFTESVGIETSTDDIKSNDKETGKKVFYRFFFVSQLINSDYYLHVLEQKAKKNILGSGIIYVIDVKFEKFGFNSKR